jgi:hypothetical protein
VCPGSPRCLFTGNAHIELWVQVESGAQFFDAAVDATCC